ncbi:hypothetical protein PBAC_01190 [Pedobacter glucosidilyticus]|nr:YqgE/AlgH family protein [Pedobacter glucosidilyticus]KHJ39609.1 hypothetical protein PBAC_01190 [Pedobacter glucosidilyticus]
MLSKVLPKVGDLLISEPFMLDENFKRSVVLLTERGDEGDIGYVLNHKSNLLLKDIISDCWDANFLVHIGGPVANDTLNFIHCSPDKIPGGIPIGKDLFWGGDFETLKLQINSYNITEAEVKFFIGYSGWDKGQLVAEINENSWIVSDQYNPAMIFEYSDKNIWKEAILNLGVKYAHVANFPENPEWN